MIQRIFFLKDNDGSITAEYVVFVAATGIILAVGVWAVFNGMYALFNAWAGYFGAASGP